MSVVLHHLYFPVATQASTWLPSFLIWLFGYGYLGVDIFFVISGFVISYSVRNGADSWAFLGRFAFRRMLRLDPPYWVAIALHILIVIAGSYLFVSLNTKMPSWQQVVAHLFYAQELLGYHGMVAVFWTLCLEVQFYVVLVSSLVMRRRLIVRWPQLANSQIWNVIAGLVFVISISMFAGLLRNPNEGLFIARWWEFFLGVLAYGCLAQGRLTKGFALAIGAVVALAFFPGRMDDAAAGLLAAIPIVYAALNGKMEAWLNWRWLQFLGLISYSLYLIHADIGWRVIKVTQILLGGRSGILIDWFEFLLGVGVSVLAAWIMYRLIETPSLNLCKRVNMKQPLRLRVIFARRSAAGAQD